MNKNALYYFQQFSTNNQSLFGQDQVVKAGSLFAWGNGQVKKSEFLEFYIKRSRRLQCTRK